MEGFPTTVAGLVMSGYFAGFAAGSILAPGLVAWVGHIRVFAVLASIAALSHILWIEAIAMGLMRLPIGFCYAGIYVVAQSWLNNLLDFLEWTSRIDTKGRPSKDAG